MKFNLSKDKSVKICTLIYLAVAIGLWIWSRYPVWALPLLTAVYFLVFSLQVHLSEKEPRWWTVSFGRLPWYRSAAQQASAGDTQTAGEGGKLSAGSGKKTSGVRGLWRRLFPRQTMTYGRMISWLYLVFLYVAGPIFTTFCVQRVILESEFFVKTGASTWILNVKVIFLVYLAVLLVLNRPKWAWILTHSFFLIAVFVDYFVYEFRGNEITYGDLTTIKTGISVASEYQYKMSERGAIILLVSIIVITLVWKFNFRFLHFWNGRVIALVILMLMYPSVKTTVLKRVTQTWEKKGTYKNGFVVNFICGARDFLVVDPPTGYSLEAVQALEDEYREKLAQKEAELAAASGDEETVKPTIITVMDESFADFRLIGDLDTNIEVTPYIDSLMENTVRGFALVSVFGAKTPNSEWEYMTGNSMAFMPGGAVPYQQFMDKQPTSMVSYLKSEGYTAVAMHPYYRTGWSRNTVYPKLGFDEMHFLDDGDDYYDETNILRDYVTDEELFSKIIARYEEKDEDEQLFIMSITMQNHGGYKDTYENFTNDVYVAGGLLFADADQYLSLIHETDSAVEMLISYFETVDEPVEIVFFGDHYPSLSSSFVKTVNGKGLSGLTLTELEGLFDVPFFIWTNYDTEEQTDVQTSLNLLHTMVYQQAGLAGTAYDLFLEEFSEVIPAINARGYYSLTDGKYKHISDATGEEAEWIKKYRILQYNNMFGKSERSEFFFPYDLGEEDEE